MKKTENPTTKSVIPERKPKFGELDEKRISNSGWISPEGAYYACSFEEHCDLADHLIKTLNLGEIPIDGPFVGEELLEKLGWAKISSDGTKLGTAFYRWGRQTMDFTDYYTQKQFDVIFDWCLRRKRKMPARIKVQE